MSAVLNRFLLLVLISVIYLSVANAGIVFNNTHPMPGETISFSGDISISKSPYYRVLLKEPSGRYAINQNCVNLDVNYDNNKREYHINGTIKISKDFAPGEYSLVFDFTHYLSDTIKKYDFVVGDYSDGWRYTQSYPGANWNKEEFDDSRWSIGHAPFANPSLFPGYANTYWTSNTIYLRKDVYLNNFTQANLKMFAENTVNCWVNGHSVGGNSGISALRTGNCYGKDWVYYGSRLVEAVSDSYEYKGIKFVDISKYLKPGKNIIACRAEVYNDVYRICVYWPNCRYYPGRQFADVEFLPLQKGEIFWTKYGAHTASNWYSPNLRQESTYFEYSCSEVGTTHTSHVYTHTKNWIGKWQWNSKGLTDDTTFYIKPEHFNWNSDYNHRTIYWGSSPFNGGVTLFRKWIWSDKNKYAILKLSVTKTPHCYINGKHVNLELYNTPYWNYYSDVKLNKGLNLIACQEAPSTFSIFDLTTSGFDGKLKISNVSVKNLDNGVKLNIKLENLAHPEVQSLIVVDVDNDTYTKEINLSHVFYQDVTQNINISYLPGWIVNNHFISSINASYGGRANDKNWDTYAYLRNLNSMRFEKEYTLAPNLTLDTLKIKYKFEGELTLYVYNYNTHTFDNVSTSKSESPIIKVVDVPNATNYVSSHGKVKLRMDVKKGQFLRCYSGRCYPYYSNAYYYEDEIYAKGMQSVYTNFTKIKSYENTEMFIPLNSGNYSITISAIDLIDNDTDIFRSNFELALPTANKIGFIPLTGNSNGKDSSHSKEGLIIVAAASAIASASAAVSYLSRGKSTSLKRIETSLSKVDNILSRLQQYRSDSINENKFAFFKMLSGKYTAFKKHMRERWKEEERVKAIREYLIELEEKAKREEKEWFSKETAKLVGKLSGSYEHQIRQIDKFLSGHDVDYEDAKRLLHIREKLFGMIFGIARDDVSDLVRKFAKKIGLKNYVNLGRWSDQLRLIIDDPTLRSKFSEFLSEQSYIPGENSNDNSYGDSGNSHDVNEEGGDDFHFWLDEFTGAFGGLTKYMKLSFKDLINKYTDIGSSLLKGDIISVFRKWFSYSKEDIKSLVTIIKNNYKEIILSFIAGLVAGAIIATTGGLGTPLALTISAAILSAGAIQLGKKYSEPLNELNNAQTDEEIESAYNNLRNMISGDVIVISTGILSSGIGGYIGGGMSISPGDINYEISTPDGLTVEVPKATIEEMENGFSSSWGYDGEWDPNPPIYISPLDELVASGIPVERAEQIISEFNNFEIVWDLDSPLAVKPSDGTLLINPSEVNSLSDKAFDFGLLHEKSELIKAEMIDEGKILSDAEVENMVDQLSLSPEMKQELEDIIIDRLIADKITLKNHPEALDGWKEESNFIIWLDNYDTSLPVAGKDIIWLAYLKTLAPDTAVITKVNQIVNTFDTFTLNRFNKIYSLMKMVIVNV